MPRYFSERGREHDEVLDRIRKKYGDRARILMHKTVPASGLFGLLGRSDVEYTGYLVSGEEALAAQKTRDDENRAAILAVAGKSAESVKLRPQEIPDEVQDVNDQRFVEVLKEIRELKGQLVIGASTPPAEPFPVLSELTTLLTDNEFDGQFVRDIADHIRATLRGVELENREVVHREAARFIGGCLRFHQAEFDEKPRIFVLVGPTGVGKTTTIAKLAAVHGLSGKPADVRIITVDSFRIGARAQVETYGEIMGIPVKAVDDYDNLRRQIALSSDADLILVDTIGKSPRDIVKIEEMKQLLSACSERAEVHLAVSATTKTADLKDVIEKFQTFGFQSVVLTKLDETTRIGNLISLFASAGIPLSYLTDGQSVPLDISVASPQRLLSRIRGLDYVPADFEQGYPVADLTAAWR